MFVVTVTPNVPIAVQGSHEHDVMVTAAHVMEKLGEVGLPLVVVCDIAMCCSDGTG